MAPSESSITCQYSAASDPFFRAAAVADRVEVGGDPQWSGGQPIAPSRPGGAEDGVFARWSWDGRRLVAVNDRYGFYPLFYWADRGSIVISPSIVRLLNEGAPRELDDVAVAVFLRFGSYLGEDTPFRSVRAMPPGATLTWTADGLEVNGSYVFRSLEKMNRDQALTEYVDRFREAVRRRILPDKPIVHPLSGGRDSRHILLELCELGAKPTLAFTTKQYPPAWSQDVEIAARVAHRLGVRHSVWELPKSQGELQWAANRETGLCRRGGARTVAVERVLAGRRVCLHDGVGGDILSAGWRLDRRGLELVDEGRFDRLARHLRPRVQGDREAYLRSLLSPAAYRRFGPEAGYGRVERELRRHAEAPNPISSFFFWNRTRRDIALEPFRVHRHHTVLAPFLDHDVFDLLAAQPASLFLDGKFHTDAIHRAHPRHADLPFARAYDRQADRTHFRHFAKDLLGRALRRRSLSPLRTSRAGVALLATAVSGRRTWWLHDALYLLQLYQVVADGFGPDAGGFRGEGSEPPEWFWACPTTHVAEEALRSVATDRPAG